MQPNATQQQNRASLAKLAGVAVLMLGFSYALIPLYNKLCEVTGLNILAVGEQVDRKIATNTQVDTSRAITVELDANTQGAWRFKPQTAQLKVHPGQLVTVTYELENTRAVSVNGQAVPSYAPQHAGSYFNKLDCFCFKQQAMAPHEKKEFPLVFVIDPKLPQNVNTITLSYTFFEIAPSAVQRKV